MVDLPLSSAAIFLHFQICKSRKSTVFESGHGRRSLGIIRSVRRSSPQHRLCPAKSVEEQNVSSWIAVYSVLPLVNLFCSALKRPIHILMITCSHLEALVFC